jgi:hypothetical protein
MLSGQCLNAETQVLSYLSRFERTAEAGRIEACRFSLSKSCAVVPTRAGRHIAERKPEGRNGIARHREKGSRVKCNLYSITTNRRHSGMRRRDKIAKLFCAEGAGPESIEPLEHLEKSIPGSHLRCAPE